MRRGRDFVLLVGSQAAGQLCLLAAIPVLTRTFEPADFGAYQLALAVSIVAQPIASLRLEFIIPVVNSETAASRFFRIGMTMTAAVSISFLLVGLGFFAFDRPPFQTQTLILVGTLLLAGAWGGIDNARLIRRRENRRLAARNLLAGTLSAALQLAAAIVTGSIILLGVAVLSARLISIVMTMPRSSKQSASGSTVPEAEEILYGVRRAITTVTAGVVSNASVHSLTLLTSVFFGPAPTAQVGTAQRIAGSPISLIGQALGQYFQGHAARLIRSRDPSLRAVTLRFVGALTVAAVPLAAAMIFLGPLLAEPVLGPGWKPAGTAIAILAIPTALQLVIAPTIPLMVMLNRERLLLVLQILRLASAILGGVIPGLTTGDFLYACLGYSIATSVAYIVTVAITVALCRSRDKSILATR